MVGAKGFEPSTSWSRTRRASQAALRPDISSIAIQLCRQRLQEYHSFRQAIDEFSTAHAMMFRQSLFTNLPVQNGNAAKPNPGPAAFQLVVTFSEAIPQREFHHPRPGQRSRILSESAADIDFRQRTERIEPH